MIDILTTQQDISFKMLSDRLAYTSYSIQNDKYYIVKKTKYKKDISNKPVRISINVITALHDLKIKNSNLSERGGGDEEGQLGRVRIRSEGVDGLHRVGSSVWGHHWGLWIGDLCHIGFSPVHGKPGWREKYQRVSEQRNASRRTQITL